MNHMSSASSEALATASFTQLALRIALATPFFMSGLTKWDSFFQISDSAVYLFAEELRLHIFGYEYAYPFPRAIAVITGSAEIALPILLVLGLGTRIEALGLLAMTAVIQVTVPDGWANFHLPWAAMALAILAYGPGELSLDRLIVTIRRSLFKGNTAHGERLSRN
jgi:putative oxidoreductase